MLKLGAPRFQRFVAIGDSQTEGVGDLANPDGSERGWADRFAQELASSSPLRYANLAVRGRRIAEIHNEQLAPALALEPDLASVIAGVNDLIRPRFDQESALYYMREMQLALRAAGATVLTTTFPDLSSFLPAARFLQSRLSGFNQALRSLAAETGVNLVDLDRLPEASDPDLWCDDRLHLNSLGHRRLAEAMAASIGLKQYEPAPGAFNKRRQSLGAELRWIYAFVLPWIGRRLTGRSSGDGRQAKRPRLVPIDAATPIRSVGTIPLTGPERQGR